MSVLKYWDPVSQSWKTALVGAQGPQGPTGSTGPASTIPGPTGATGSTGATGAQGYSIVNLDGGSPTSTYGGISAVNLGGVS